MFSFAAAGYCVLVSVIYVYALISLSAPSIIVVFAVPAAVAFLTLNVDDVETLEAILSFSELLTDLLNVPLNALIFADKSYEESSWNVPWITSIDPMRALSSDFPILTEASPSISERPSACMTFAGTTTLSSDVSAASDFAVSNFELNTARILSISPFAPSGLQVMTLANISHCTVIVD